MSERHRSPVEEIAKLKGRLSEAIAQRDEALERTKLLDNAHERWGDDAALSWHADTQQWAAHHRMYDQDVRVEALERQLAAERALCDRLAAGLFETPPSGRSRGVIAALDQYDAHRAAERSDG